MGLQNVYRFGILKDELYCLVTIYDRKLLDLGFSTWLLLLILVTTHF
jgi:hypothetical protein